MRLHTPLTPLNPHTCTACEAYSFQDSYPGNLWTNLFFFQNFFCAFAGAIYQAVQERQLRLGQPGRFPPGPLEEARLAYREWRARTTASAAGGSEQVMSTTADAFDIGGSCFDLQSASAGERAAPPGGPPVK